MRLVSHTPRFYKPLGVVLLMVVLTLAGCGGGGSGSTSGNNANIKITIGSKNDADGQLLAEMYSLILAKHGYSVTTKLQLGQNKVLDTAIKSGAIDMYPEFTGTALSVNNLPATQDPHQAFNEVKQYYEQNFQITWLDAAFNLNDSYGLCTNQQISGQHNLKSMSDLVSVAPQLVLAGQQDFLDPQSGIFPPVAKAYGLAFKDTVQISEQLGFDAVNKGNAQINECYTTDPAIVVDNFVLLSDDKNAFPAYNPAPIVRDDLLRKAPAIATLLQPLESKLTTASQTALIKEVSVDKKSVKEAAQTWLQQEGLL
jgi:osmoprotectant transport system substrate-binding protein